ncbi:MAG TPA: amidohydrolase family protein [Myxococcota bacterium]|nr:amidohydrolase family protein [Myxococcota bacterium]
MLDLVIRNGRIVDGSGLPAFRGDVGIRDGRLVCVGGRLRTPARREIEARGRVVAPGFIDPHTHLDAQLLWDGQARPSLEHGVTTVVHGNCSLSLAPLKAEHRPKLVSMFQQIEEMPDAALHGAFEWTWEGFADYVDALRGRIAINVAPLAGHSVLRLWAMGAEAQKRAATPDEIRAMEHLLRSRSSTTPTSRSRASTSSRSSRSRTGSRRRSRRCSTPPPRRRTSPASSPASPSR